jgi:hypothetical protein
MVKEKEFLFSEDYLGIKFPSIELPLPFDQHWSNARRKKLKDSEKWRYIFN